MTEAEGNDGRTLAQLFLDVDDTGDRVPELVARPADEKSHPANLLLLKGAVVEVGDEFDAQTGWDAAGRVAELCRLGSEMDGPQHAALCEHLSYVHAILADCVLNASGGGPLTSESLETLLRGAIDRCVRAGKCVGFSLE